MSDQAMKAIEKKFGDGVICSANSILDKKRTLIPVSPSINFLLGGGITSGSFVLINGVSKLGKTSICLHFAAKAQLKEYGGEFCPEGRDCFYYNVEGRVKERDILAQKGINADKFHIVQSTPGNILYGEQYLQICEQLINSVPGSIHIIDSFSMLVSQNELVGDMTDLQRADIQKTLYKFTRKISNVLPVNDIILMGVVHVIANVSGWGASLVSKSGNAIKYAADYSIFGKSFKFFPANSDNPLGQELELSCTTSALNGTGRKCTTILRYGEGIDEVQELITLSTDFGLLEAKGAGWFTLTFLKDEFSIKNEEPPKIQGTEKLRKYLNENPVYLKILEERVNEMTGVKNQ